MLIFSIDINYQLVSLQQTTVNAKISLRTQTSLSTQKQTSHRRDLELLIKWYFYALTTDEVKWFPCITQDSKEIPCLTSKPL